jgi:signal transduction histidine kinase
MTPASSGRRSPFPHVYAMPTSPLAWAIAEAAARTSATVAASTRRPTDEVRRRLDDVVHWLTAQTAPHGAPTDLATPPVIAREYVDLLRSALLSHLASIPVLDGQEVVAVLQKLEELTQGWRKTDRGRFMSRLTGAEAADAVVAIAHDIRSPLTSILILVDSLRRAPGVAGDPARSRQLAIIHGAARGLNGLAEDMIDAARGEELSVGPAVPFSVSETIEAVADILRPISEERSLPLHLYPPQVDARIGHPAALHRILLNLASNALRCTETGFVSISSVELTTTKVEFSVIDTGAGIPANVLDSLAGGFIDNGLSVRFSRTGLGLAIVRALLSAMGSTLEVESRPGQGTRFFFCLELRPVT